MKSARWTGMLGLAACLAIAQVAIAQQNTPHIGYIYPAGGRVGTTFEVKIGGQFLDDVKEIHIAGAGVKAEFVEHTKPLSMNQANILRMKMKELQEKRRLATEAIWRPGRAATRPSTAPAFTAEDQRLMAEIFKKLAGYTRKPNAPSIQETVTLKVSIAADAPPTQRELRLATPTGLSNPLIFCVGQQPEVTPEEPKATLALDYRPFQTPEPKTGLRVDAPITLPAVINGRIMPGTVDHYHFKAHRGERIVVAVNARGLIPYIADAVPGWFQAVAALYDAKGKEVAYADHFEFHPDPVLYYEIQSDGEYTLEIRDSIYRGREDFVYRISVGQLPFVTSIFPLGGRVGTVTDVELTGWNLPTTKVTMDALNWTPGVHPLYVRKEQWNSNRTPFAVNVLPEILEREPNDTMETAQPITLPVIVNGRINRPGDWDVFRFEGRGGDKIVAEVVARRLNSPLDSILKLVDAKGQQVAINDDFEDKGAGLITHQADSYISATLPASGAYYLWLGDTQHQGGPEFAYRLRVSPPRPDFELRVTPSSISVRTKSTAQLTVYALRRDGFSDKIELALKDAPAGFKLSSTSIAGNQESVKVTLTAPSSGSKELFTLNIEGRATIGGKAVTRAAIPSEDMMQAFAYRHLVPSRELKVEVAEPPKFASRAMANAVMTSPAPIRIPMGGTAHVHFLLPLTTFLGKLQVEMADAPEGITLGEVTHTETGLEVALHCSGKKMKMGTKGNLVLSAATEKAGIGALLGAGGKNKTEFKRRNMVGNLPTVPFEIVSP